MKSFLKKLIDRIFGKRCECKTKEVHHPMVCVDCGKVF